MDLPINVQESILRGRPNQLKPLWGDRRNNCPLNEIKCLSSSATLPQIALVEFPPCASVMCDMWSLFWDLTQSSSYLYFSFRYCPKLMLTPSFLSCSWWLMLTPTFSVALGGSCWPRLSQLFLGAHVDPDFLSCSWGLYLSLSMIQLLTILPCWDVSVSWNPEKAWFSLFLFSSLSPSLLPSSPHLSLEVAKV